jgi:putative salt-induced outer membrane protein
MVFQRAHFVTLLLAVCSVSALADQLTFINGDRVTGTIVSADGTNLTFKTDYAGTLTIKLDAVQNIASEQPLYVATKTGRVVVGKVSADDGNVQIATQDAGHVNLQRQDIKTMRSEAEQRTYGAWGGYLNSGLSLARGNANTTDFTVGATAARITDRTKAAAFVNSIRSSGRANGVTLTTASAIHAGLRFDLNLSERTFAFVFTDFDHDRFQQLNLRNVIGGGLGYHVVKTTATNFDLFGGASLNQEYFTTLTRRSGELLAGESLDHKLSSAFSVHQRLEFYPNISDIGQYRVVFDLGTITKISKIFSWQLDASDRYITNPVNGLKGNDLLFTTGVRVSFGATKGM